MASPWIDVSVTLRTGMVTWPGDPPARISHALDMERGDPCTVSLLEMGAHTGTHMDAPAHFVRGGSTPTHSYMKCLYKYPQSARVPRPWPWVNEDSPEGRQAKLVFEECHGLARGYLHEGGDDESAGEKWETWLSWYPTQAGLSMLPVRGVTQ